MRRAEALEARFGLRLAAALERGSSDLPHDLTERLRFGREQALARARELRQATAAAPAVGRSGGAAVLAAPPGTLWWRAVSALPLLMLVAGLFLIARHNEQEQITAVAEFDSALLADELPPAAYRDPGFLAFLLSQDTE